MRGCAAQSQPTLRRGESNGSINRHRTFAAEMILHPIERDPRLAFPTDLAHDMANPDGELVDSRSRKHGIASTGR